MHRVVVNAAEKQGAADLEGLMGMCMFGPDMDVNSNWHKAWHEVGLKYLRGPSLDFPRKKNTEGELDFSGLDEVLQVIQTMGAVPLFGFCSTPHYLSSNPEAQTAEDHYSHYAPKDYALWEQVIEATIHHIIEKWGYKGACYEVWNEPEDYKSYFKGKPGSTGIDLLADYTELYVHTAKAVKRADPAATIGGPATAHWDSAAGGAHAWGLPQFLRALYEYNQAHPNDQAALDYIDWHDYTWISHCPNLMDGVRFVDEILGEIGWQKERPEYWITEWNLGFGEYGDPYPAAQYVAHAASNFLENANPLTRRISRLYYYLFDSDPNPKVALISGWVPSHFKKPEAPEPTGKILLQPRAAVFQMANALNHGALVRCETNWPVTAAATQEGNTLRVMVSNYDAEPCKIELALKGIAKTDGELQCCIQRVDETHSSDGKGLEKGESSKVKTTGGAATLPLDMPAYGAVLVTVE